RSAFNLGDGIYDSFEAMAGQRFHPSYTRVGGLMVDVSDEWVEMIRKFVKDEFPKAHADVGRLLNRKKIFIHRTRGIGVLTRDEAINRSASGPVLRASGVAR